MKNKEAIEEAEKIFINDFLKKERRDQMRFGQELFYGKEDEYYYKGKKIDKKIIRYLKVYHRAWSLTKLYEDE